MLHPDAGWHLAGTVDQSGEHSGAARDADVLVLAGCGAGYGRAQEFVRGTNTRWTGATA